MCDVPHAKTTSHTNPTQQQSSVSECTRDRSFMSQHARTQWTDCTGAQVLKTHDIIMRVCSLGIYYHVYATYTGDICQWCHISSPSLPLSLSPPLSLSVSLSPSPSISLQIPIQSLYTEPADIYYTMTEMGGMMLQPQYYAIIHKSQLVCTHLHAQFFSFQTKTLQTLAICLVVVCQWMQWYAS